MKRTREQTILVRSIKNPSITRRMTVTSARLNAANWETMEVKPPKSTIQEVEIIQPTGEHNVVAVIPVKGRIPLVTKTIERLLTKNKVKVVCVCSEPGEAEQLKGTGAHVIEHENYPLGAKWNAGFVEAKKLNPDACLFVGSSDWVSDNWVSSLLPLMDKYDMVGTAGCRFLDIGKGRMKALNWHGYIGDREDESIGIGRLISARILNAIGWKPFHDDKDGSLDYSMQNKVIKAGGKSAMVHHDELISMAISTDKWENKHKFKDHETGLLRRNSIPIKDLKGFLNTHFPEAYHIFK